MLKQDSITGVGFTRWIQNSGVNLLNSSPKFVLVMPLDKLASRLVPHLMRQHNTKAPVFAWFRRGRKGGIKRLNSKF